MVAAMLAIGCAPSGSTDVVAETDLPVRATPEIVAARLGRLIWNGEPDSSVVDGLGAAVTRETAGAVAEKMLRDTRARAGVAAFYRWWLLFDDVEGARQPEELRADLQAEGPALGTYLTLDQDGTFTDLLTSPHTMMNENLAQFYGIPGVVGTQMRPVRYPAGEPRLGLLGGAGVLSFFTSLANLSWPAKRGWLITDPLLCTPVVRSFLPTDEPDPNRSIRKQMIDATSMPSCVPCHEVLNSPGFAFTAFDSLGRWRPQPGAAPNETEGWIPEKIMPDMPHFDGPTQLAHLLASRLETRRCFVNQWLRYAVDRSARVTTDIPAANRTSVDAALSAFSAADLRLRSLIVAVARTNMFLRP